jgi:hypothetical protein
MVSSTTEAPLAREFRVLMLMVILVLAVWSVSLVGTVVLFRNAMPTEQSVAAPPDPPEAPE